MCTGDLTLVSTGVDLEFDHSPPRMCRDFGAVGKWVKERMWEYERWTGMITVGGPFVSPSPIPPPFRNKDKLRIEKN